MATERVDNWRTGPLVTLLGLTGFVVYTTWALLQGEHYFHGSYLSPMYSPLLWVELDVPGAGPLEHAWFGEWPSWLASWWPSFIPRSPAIFILIFPGLFRFSCYYYRKSIYRAFTGTPPACAVNALPQRRYDGETRFLIFQNLHRYALYFALCYVVILYYDGFISFYRYGEFGCGVGCFVMLINATLIAGYTCGCHCFRHLVGGKLNSYSGGQMSRFNLWSKVSKLNAKHQEWAWASMIWVGFTDFYIRMVSMGYISDLNTWD